MLQQCQIGADKIKGDAECHPENSGLRPRHSQKLQIESGGVWG